jgi:3-hydroxybutyryl-CoA dehydrogenase
MALELSTVGVVGLGTMGAGIVEVFARGGLAVVAVDVDRPAVDRGRAHLERSTGRAVERGRLTGPARAELLARITFADTPEALAGCDLVVEAVPEHLDLKHETFRRLDDVCRPDAVLATNTSSLSVTEIAAATRRPGRVIGLHFFNPAPVLGLVEVVGTVMTDEGVIREVTALAARLGKRPVAVGDRAGFIANALLFGYLNRAIAMIESRYATREDVDAAMRLGCGLPMGPFALLDLIGLDTAQEILRTMYRQTGDRLHAPAPLLGQLVAAGFLGRKNGRGFYTYAAPGVAAVVADALAPTASVSGPMRPTRVVGVIGAGARATQIARTLARAGCDVTVTIRPADLADVDLVVETAGGDPADMRALFERLDGACRPGAILATGASSGSVIACAATTSRPADVVGLRFFDPTPTTGLVEVVRTVRTAADVVDAVVGLCRRAGHHPVVCGDRAGFIVDALLFPYLNDAVRMLAARYASADDIDTAMTSGCGYPVGPFELLDAVGLDVAAATQSRIYEESREPGLAPAPLLGQLVAAGYLGRASGRGFRTYS